MAAIADAKRNQMTGAYAPVREAAKERQREAGKEYGRGQGKLKEKIPEPIVAPIMAEGMGSVRHAGSIWRTSGSPAQTRDIRAKAAGTNPKYIGKRLERVDRRRCETSLSGVAAYWRGRPG